MEMEVLVKEKRVDFRICSILILIVLSCGLICEMSAKNQLVNSIINEENVVLFNQDWNYRLESGISGEITLPAIIKEAKRDEEVILTNYLPEKFMSGMTICIRSSQQRIKVWVENTLIYEYGNDKSKYVGKSCGSRWNLIRIPEGSMGKAIKIMLSSPYERYNKEINGITYGSKSALVFDIIKNHYFYVLYAIIIFFLGIAGLILYGIQKRKHICAKKILYLSIFTLLISGWLFSESKMMQFVIGNQVMINLMLFLPMLISPLPILMYVEQSYESHRKKAYPIMIVTQSIYVVFCMVLQAANIKDFIEMNNITHILFFVYIFGIVYLLLTELYQYKRKEVYQIAIPAFLLIFFMILEMISHYFEILGKVTTWFQFGFVVFLIFSGREAVEMILNMMEKNKEVEYYQKLAYIDLLTEGNNRTAYFEKISNDYNTVKKCEGMCLVQFDLNNLKYINDNFGHMEGDDALRRTYDCIDMTYGKYGTCYRIGGDEFACILPVKYSQYAESLYVEFKEVVSNMQGGVKYPFQIAVGYDKFRIEEDTNFDDLSIRVDKKMYLNKRKSKIKE